MKRASVASDWIYLLLLVVASVALGRWQTVNRSQARADPISQTAQALHQPIASGLNSIGGGVSDFFGGLANASQLARDNRRLSAEIAGLSLYSEQISRLDREVDSLRATLGMPTPPGRVPVPADIVGYFPHENRLTLSVGIQDGIRVGMPVVTPKGLVGTVQTVGARRCQVLLINSRGLKFGGIVANRNPMPVGIAQGVDAATLVLTLADPRAPIQVGDAIVTAGFSERIPKGIPVGVVIQIEDDPDFGERRALIDPYVAVGELREVTVLR